MHHKPPRGARQPSTLQRRCVAHQRGRSRHTRSCCCVVGYANDRHPDAAAAAHPPSGRACKAWSRTAHAAHTTRAPDSKSRAQAGALAVRRAKASGAPFTVSREQDIPSVRTRYRSAFFGHERGLRTARLSAAAACSGLAARLAARRHPGTRLEQRPGCWRRDVFESATHPLLCVYGTKSGRNAMERSSLPEVEATLLSGTASAGRRCAAASSRLPTSAASCR